VEEIGKMEVFCLCADPHRFNYRIGVYGERVVKEIIAAWHLPVPKNYDWQTGWIQVLKRERILRLNKDDNLYVPRKRRNGVVHAEMDTHHNFIVWSGMNIYFDYNGQNSQYSVECILVKCLNQCTQKVFSA
jgi:hypothetical protein